MVGTRLLSEKLVGNRFPHLRYIRIHTPEKHKATIYAWNGELYLPEKDAQSVQDYASGYLYPYVNFQVKAYSAVQPDKVPQLARDTRNYCPNSDAQKLESIWHYRGDKPIISYGR